MHPVDTNAARDFAATGDTYTGAEVRLWVHNLCDELDAARQEVAYLEHVEDILRHKLAHTQASLDRAVKILTGIHMLAQPEAITASDGKAYEFVPPAAITLDTWRELRHRIREIPTHLAAAQAPVSQPAEQPARTREELMDIYDAANVGRL